MEFLLNLVQKCWLSFILICNIRDINLSIFLFILRSLGSNQNLLALYLFCHQILKDIIYITPVDGALHSESAAMDMIVFKGGFRVLS